MPMPAPAPDLDHHLVARACELAHTGRHQADAVLMNLDFLRTADLHPSSLSHPRGHQQLPAPGQPAARGAIIRLEYPAWPRHTTPPGLPPIRPSCRRHSRSSAAHSTLNRFRRSRRGATGSIACAACCATTMPRSATRSAPTSAIAPSRKRCCSSCSRASMASPYARRRLRRWMRTERRSVAWWSLPGSARLMRQPLGVVGIIVPWNYPLYLAVSPLTAALAAGNRAMLKMSEYTPRFGALFESLIAATFASDEVVAVNGDVGVARAFAALPFDHLLFTGSTGSRPRGHEGREREPDAGDARARRQVAGDRRRRVRHRGGRAPHHVRQADQRRPDLRRARLRAGAEAGHRPVPRRLPRRDARVLSRRSRPTPSTRRSSTTASSGGSRRASRTRATLRRDHPRAAPGPDGRRAPAHDAAGA